MKAKTVCVVAAVAGLFVGGYWYWSPLLTLSAMKEAARTSDADSFNRHVDYQALRENLKQRVQASFSSGASSVPDSERAQAVRGFATLVATRAVDTLVRPEVVMQLMRVGQLQPEVVPSKQAAPGPSEKKLEWAIRHEGVNQFVVTVVRADSESPQSVSVVLNRRGFADWQLTDIRLPVGDKPPQTLRPMVPLAAPSASQPGA